MVKSPPHYGALIVTYVLVVDTDSDQDIVFTPVASIDRIMAYHEAGHTVAALVRGLPLQWTSVSPPKTMVRNHLLLPSFHDFIAIERDAVVTLAGEMAEKRIHDDYEPASDDDKAHLQTLAATLYPDDPNGANEWTARMKIKTEALVEKHWNNIVSVAMKLLSDPLHQFSAREIKVHLGR